jgi:uncharacterized membrane protein
MQRQLLQDSPSSLTEGQKWLALGAGALMLVIGARRHRLVALSMAAAATPLLYRGFTGRWPSFLMPSDDTKIALAGARGVHVRESVVLDLPIADVYRFWRRLENLPRFMAHLEAVAEDDLTGRSHWIAAGPGGLRVEWDAEIINEVENHTLGWRSLPGSDVITAGSVNFDRENGDRSTKLTVHLQYAPPAGRAGARVAWLFGRAPEQTIREDLRRLKELLEAGGLRENPSTAHHPFPTVVR